MELAVGLLVLILLRALYVYLARISLSSPRRTRRQWNRMRSKVAPSVHRRSRYRCRHCRTRSNLTVDHIRPIARHGSNRMVNLQTLCAPCNRRKGTS